MKLNKLLICYVILVSINVSVSQNLVYNGGFEIYKKCPDNFSQIEKALGWKMPSIGTSDYFNSCANSNVCGVPQNTSGRSFPHSGSAYAGFGLFIKEETNEFMQTKFLEPLSPDKTYCFEFFIKKASKYRFSFDELSFLFSTDELHIEKNFYSDAQINDNNLITYKLSPTYKDEWIKICLLYKPRKTENFLTIGFNEPKDINELHLQARKEGSYYYIDDVSLVEVKDGVSCNCSSSEPVVKDCLKAGGSQNLITNGDFETFGKCPDNISQLSRAKGWDTPSEGTSDYFNACSKSLWTSATKNFEGNAHPKSGNGYAGITMVFDSGLDKRYEFIQTKMENGLQKDHIYCISFYVFRSQKSTDDYNQFSCLISRDKVRIKEWEFFSNEAKTENIFVSSPPGEVPEKDWKKKCFKFISKGDEKYVTIGFDEYKKTSSDKPYKEKNLYYYIDDVSLVEIKEGTECSCSVSKPLKKDSVKAEVVKSFFDGAEAKPLILSNIVFESNKSTLLPASNDELNKLVQYLKSNPAKSIQLFGYTDNTGKEPDNIKLSEARVRAVSDYLIKNGITAKRISYKGYGSQNPLMPNDTEVNKAKNRRVEFSIK